MQNHRTWQDFQTKIHFDAQYNFRMGMYSVDTRMHAVIAPLLLENTLRYRISSMGSLPVHDLW